MSGDLLLIEDLPLLLDEDLSLLPDEDLLLDIFELEFLLLFPESLVDRDRLLSLDLGFLILDSDLGCLDLFLETDLLEGDLFLPD